MTSLGKQIEAKRAELRELNRQKREALNLAQRTPKIARKRGRKAMSAEIIKKAELLAYDNPIPTVALKLGAGLTTLYKYGIKRYILKEKN